MTIKQIIDNVDLSENNDQWVDFETLGEELGLNWEQIQDIEPDKNEFLKSVYISKHLCTDSIVGLEAFFLDGVFICLTHQSARKSPTEVVGWVSKELAEKTKEYLISLIPEEDKAIDIEILDLSEDINEGFKVQYADQLVHDEFYYNGERAKLIKIPKKAKDGGYNFHDIIIEQNGKEETIDIREIIVPYCTR